MNFQDTFLSAFCSTPNIKKNASPKQLLGTTFPDALLSDAFPYLLSGGQIHAQTPLFYDFSMLPCYLLIHTLSGSGTLADASGSYSLSADTVFFYDCSRPFRLSINSTVWNFNILYLCGASVSFYYNSLSETPYLHMLPASSAIPDRLEHITATRTVTSTAQALCISKWITDVLTELSVESENKNLPVHPAEPYLSEMKEMFDHSYMELYTLNKLEEHFKISKYRLCREFTQTFGISPLQYLNRTRIEASKTLLLSTSYPVHEVGSLVGIDNPNHFINLFKRQVNTTPLVYRQSSTEAVRLLHSPDIPAVPLQ